jgi:hypothetical protein
MNNQLSTDQIQAIIYNVGADVIIGKNLKKHLIDVSLALAKLDFIIRVAKINNEVTIEREILLSELLKLGREILVQLKSNQAEPG